VTKSERCSEVVNVLPSAPAILLPQHTTYSAYPPSFQQHHDAIIAMRPSESHG
jgi:hypothetical protein